MENLNKKQKTFIGTTDWATGSGGIRYYTSTFIEYNGAEFVLEYRHDWLGWWTIVGISIGAPTMGEYGKNTDEIMEQMTEQKKRKRGDYIYYLNKIEKASTGGSLGTPERMLGEFFSIMDFPYGTRFNAKDVEHIMDYLQYNKYKDPRESRKKLFLERKLNIDLDAFELYKKLN